MRVLLLFTLVATIAFSCAPDGETIQKTKSGFEYIFRKDEPGEVVGVGGAGKYYVYVYKNDSLIQSGREMNPEPSPFMLPTPEEMSPQDQPNPLIEVLPLLSKGDSVSILNRMDTLEQRPDGFEKTDILRYDVVIVDVIDRETFKRQEEERRAEFAQKLKAYSDREGAVADTVATVLAEYKGGAAKAGFTTTSSGLMYKILQPGTGLQAQVGKAVLVSYYGVSISNGEMFDNSFRAQRPIDFPLGQGRVIAGWDEGIALLSEGSRAVFAIPSALAYGENPPPGSGIAPGEDLMFYVNLQEVER